MAHENEGVKGKTKILSNKLAKKSCRKQKRAYHRLLRDMNIKCCDNPTKHLMICNSGLVTGLQREALQRIIDPISTKYDLVMPLGKSYCFIKFSVMEDAISAYNAIHGCITLEGHNAPLYVTYTESVPDLDEDIWRTEFPPGLKLIENIITEEEEQVLLNTIDWNDQEPTSSDLRHRKVKHYGYEFQYDSNKVDSNSPIRGIPKEYAFLQTLFKKHHPVEYEYDQLTINHYLPGQGIPPHIDTHSVFEDSILSLSLGSACVMDFRKEDEKVSIYLPQRSVLILAGEARYAWSHGICPRRNDILKGDAGVTTQPRSTRVSFTFRKVSTGKCPCDFPKYCDTKRTTSISDRIAKGIEYSYVHEVYEEISTHFNETRHKQWPNVAKFLDTLKLGDILLDVGCGNGKYLQAKKGVFKIGCDRSHGLINICRNKGFEVVVSDCLCLPYRDRSVDAAISIAVIHHLSTRERRKQAISEIARVLKPNGRCLIYVWAKEQEKGSISSAYLKYSTGKRSVGPSCAEQMTEYGVMLPIHENRTKFASSDMLVPWKRKGGGNFLRYYHVFEEGELERLCSEVPEISINDVYYDQGNWCIIFSRDCTVI